MIVLNLVEYQGCQGVAETGAMEIQWHTSVGYITDRRLNEYFVVLN